MVHAHFKRRIFSKCFGGKIENFLNSVLGDNDKDNFLKNLYLTSIQQELIKTNALINWLIVISFTI